ncbi:uncharacterized protein VTP21DRAFT_10060 [Calcarisporiella thermophila]|uniref:uncharacterized protein n=1 Tax=Calcarisporiella thermophila TaxID=911321 RepID=UPI0037429032
MVSFPISNPVRLSAVNVLSRLLPWFFPTSQENKIDLDLRMDERFFIIIQTGLGDVNDNRKIAIYVLKRVINYTTQQRGLTTELPWTKYFQWDDDRSKEWISIWDSFFLLFDSFFEAAAVHLVKPLLPAIAKFLSPAEGSPNIHPSWWTLMLKSGLKNEILNIRKTLLRYIFSLEDKRALVTLGRQHEFVFGQLMIALDNPALYHVPTLGTCVCGMGEALRTYVGRSIAAFEDLEESVRN